jgi:hypothetical protein
LLLEEIPDAFVSWTLKDSNGAIVPGSNATTTILTTSRLVYVSNKRLFGAWRGGEILFPMADVQIKRAQAVNATERGFADPILGPIAFQWVLGIDEYLRKRLMPAEVAGMTGRQE